MASRTALPGTSETATGTVHDGADDDKLPGGWIGYVEVAAAQLSITTLTDLTGLSVAVTVNTTRRIRITLQTITQISATDTNAVLHIRESTTTLNSSNIPTPAAGGGPSQEPRTITVVLTPSSGSHTYKASIERAGGTGSVGIQASSTQPSSLLVEDIGPAS